MLLSRMRVLIYAGNKLVICRPLAVFFFSLFFFSFLLRTWKGLHSNAQFHIPDIPQISFMFGNPKLLFFFSLISVDRNDIILILQKI